MAGVTENGGVSSIAMLRKADGSLVPFLKHTWADADQLISVVQLTRSGKILGNSGRPGAPDLVIQPWIWAEPAGFADFPGAGNDTFMAHRMNEHDQVVGDYDAGYGADCRSQRAYWHDLRRGKFLWLDHGPRDLAPGRRAWCGHFSAATAINDKGQVVGYGSTFVTAFGEPYRPFLWTESSGLAPLDTGADPRMKNIRPEAINEAGQVVGTFQYAGEGKRRYFYRDETNHVVDLQALIDPADPLAADAVFQLGRENRALINNKGQIVVQGMLRSDPHYGLYHYVVHSFLLAPID